MSYSPADDDRPRSERVWFGFIAFAAWILMLLGSFHVLGGFVALFSEENYQVGESQLVVSVDYTAWGLLHMALGAVMFAAGLALFWRATWARAFAVLVAAFSAVTNVAFLSAAPFWYALMVAFDVLVIYAITVHGSEQELDA